MARRRIGIAIAAAAYTLVHSAVLAGEFAKGAGWIDHLGPVARIFELCLLGLVVIVAGYLIPKLLRLNIAVSDALLAGLAWCGDRTDKSLDAIRRALILAAEGLASWLREREDDGTAS